MNRQVPNNDNNLLVIRLPSNDNVAIVFRKFKEIFDRREIPKDVYPDTYVNHFVNEMISTALTHSLRMDLRSERKVTPMDKAIVSFFLHPEEDAEKALDEASTQQASTQKVPYRPIMYPDGESGYALLYRVFLGVHSELRELFLQEVQLARKRTLVHVICDN